MLRGGEIKRGRRRVEREGKDGGVQRGREGWGRVSRTEVRNISYYNVITSA